MTESKAQINRLAYELTQRVCRIDSYPPADEAIAEVLRDALATVERIGGYQNRAAYEALWMTRELTKL